MLRLSEYIILVQYNVLAIRSLHLFINRKCYWINSSSTSPMVSIGSSYLLNFHVIAGVDRFELSYAAVKVLCLTAWRYPNVRDWYYYQSRNRNKYGYHFLIILSYYAILHQNSRITSHCKAITYVCNGYDDISIRFFGYISCKISRHLQEFQDSDREEPSHNFCNHVPLPCLFLSLLL